jgi:hypothetical protein
MEWIALQSSNISRVRWDPTSLVLEVEFHNGRAYQYFDVPKGVFDALCQSASVGQYFNEAIKGSFRFARL